MKINSFISRIGWNILLIRAQTRVPETGIICPPHAERGWVFFKTSLLAVWTITYWDIVSFALYE